VRDAGRCDLGKIPELYDERISGGGACSKKRTLNPCLRAVRANEAEAAKRRFINGLQRGNGRIRWQEASLQNEESQATTLKTSGPFKGRGRLGKGIEGAKRVKIEFAGDRRSVVR